MGKLLTVGGEFPTKEVIVAAIIFFFPLNICLPVASTEELPITDQQEARLERLLAWAQSEDGEKKNRWVDLDWVLRDEHLDEALGY
jgi:hypothetical protein